MKLSPNPKELSFNVRLVTITSSFSVHFGEVNGGAGTERIHCLLVYCLEDSVLNMFQVCSCVSSLSA